MKKAPPLIPLLLAGLALACTLSTAQAVSGAWTGNGANDSWNNSTNWTAAFPTTGNTATFNATVSNSTVSMNGTAVSLNNIGFNTDPGSYTFNAGGGGNQTMWLAAMDDRIAASVPVASVGTFESYVGGSNCVCVKRCPMV